MTAEAIASAAEAVFAEQGLHDAHVGEIARRAGVAVGTLYNHFKDREAILAGLLEVRQAELVSHLDARLAEAPAASNAEDFRARLRGFVAAYFEFFGAHRRFFHILMQGEAGKLQATYPVAASAPSQCMREIYARTEALMSEGCRAGVLEPASLEIYPAFLLGMMRAVKMHSFYQGHFEEKADYDGDVERLVDMFLNGAKARS